MVELPPGLLEFEIAGGQPPRRAVRPALRLGEFLLGGVEFAAGIGQGRFRVAPLRRLQVAELFQPPDIAAALLQFRRPRGDGLARFGQRGPGFDELTLLFRLLFLQEFELTAAGGVFVPQRLQFLRVLEIALAQHGKFALGLLFAQMQTVTAGNFLLQLALKMLRRQFAGVFFGRCGLALEHVGTGARLGEAVGQFRQPPLTVAGEAARELLLQQRLPLFGELRLLPAQFVEDDDGGPVVQRRAARPVGGRRRRTAGEERQHRRNDEVADDDEDGPVHFASPSSSAIHLRRSG